MKQNIPILIFIFSSANQLFQTSVGSSCCQTQVVNACLIAEHQSRTLTLSRQRAGESVFLGCDKANICNDIRRSPSVCEQKHIFFVLALHLSPLHEKSMNTFSQSCFFLLCKCPCVATFHIKMSHGVYVCKRNDDSHIHDWYKQPG